MVMDYVREEAASGVSHRLQADLVRFSWSYYIARASTLTGEVTTVIKELKSKLIHTR